MKEKDKKKETVQHDDNWMHAYRVWYKSYVDSGGNPSSPPPPPPPIEDED